MASYGASEVTAESSMRILATIGAGAVVGALLVAGPNLAGETAITDPVVLGAMWFVRPESVLPIAVLGLHLAVGVGIGVVAWLFPVIAPRQAALSAVVVNGALTVVENGQGAGVMGVGWWLIGSVLSAAVLFVGIAAVRAVRRASGARARP